MIELQQISFSYPGQPPLLQEISTCLETKKVTTILGPNGCGKSTLLKIACRLLKPSSGHILLNGQDIQHLKNKELAKQIALLSQTNQPPEITVEDLVTYGRYPHQHYGQGLDQQDQIIINHALQQVKADSYRHCMVSQLSGGQRQRAYIAMALAQDTNIIYLDEPTTYLDINIRFEIMELVRTLNQAGKTIVMVLHDLNLALAYSDTIILMDQGRIQTQGTPQQVIATGLIDQVFQIQTHMFEKNGETFYHFAQKKAENETQ